MEKSKAVLITRYSLMTKSSRERKKDGEEKKKRPKPLLLEFSGACGKTEYVF